MSRKAFPLAAIEAAFSHSVSVGRRYRFPVRADNHEQKASAAE
jgi:hypothetical protein